MQPSWNDRQIITVDVDLTAKGFDVSRDRLETVALLDSQLTDTAKRRRSTGMCRCNSQNGYLIDQARNLIARHFGPAKRSRSGLDRSDVLTERIAGSFDDHTSSHPVQHRQKTGSRWVDSNVWYLDRR